MNWEALRLGGVAAGVTVLVACIALALTAPEPARAQPTAPVLAQAPQPTPVAFLVRFRGEGPIARAQRDAARGRTSQAQAIIEAQLRRQAPFNGLCFDRFTVGAAEIVLRSCEPVAASDRAAYQQRWTARLDAMGSVEYVDPNATASTGRAPG
jgi:hypothetical protein